MYPNDLVKIVKGEKETFGYYKGCNRSTAAIDILLHDQIKANEGNGIKTLDKIEKYCIDILGNHHLVHKETRQDIKK